MNVQAVHYTSPLVPPPPRAEKELFQELGWNSIININNKMHIINILDQRNVCGFMSWNVFSSFTIHLKLNTFNTNALRIGITRTQVTPGQMETPHSITSGVCCSRSEAPSEGTEARLFMGWPVMVLGLAWGPLIAARMSG